MYIMLNKIPKAVATQHCLLPQIGTVNLKIIIHGADYPK